MATRELFFHISTAQQVFFYLLSVLSLWVCFWGVYRRFRIWQQGKPDAGISHWPSRLRDLAAQMLAHRRVRRRRYAGLFHLGIFYGMLALFIGTNIVAVEHYGALRFGPHWLYRGWFYLACKVTLDFAGLILLVGTGMALARRALAKPPAMGQSAFDFGFLALLFAATFTGYLLEGAGLAADPRRAAWAAFSPLGRLFMLPFLHGITPSGYMIAWWVHMPLVLGVIAALPYGRWLHLFVAPLTIALQPERPMGALPPVSMEEVEATGRVGLGQLSDLSRWEIMSLDGCMECGRCTDACPAHAAGKPLDPKKIVLDLRAGLQFDPGAGAASAEAASDLPVSLPPRLPLSASTDLISDEALWACTNCHACVRECPSLIRHVDLIDGIRRYRVAEGRLSGSAAVMLRQLGSRENPWGLPASQRLDWAKGLDIPAAAANDGREVLLWVGCAGAFDPRAQKTVRALAQLLQQAGVKFSVLGPKERCTGDPARRTGDDFLYQQLAEANIATLKGIGADQAEQRIVSACPHCFHTLKNEYPQSDGRFAVQHHTQFLQELVAAGRLTLPDAYEGSVAYHDPCFLARVNGETEAPRSLLRSAGSDLHEVERCGSRTFCCGAGGGRMWMEEERTQRPGLIRAQELLATGAKTVAVGCPFCKVMVGDSIAQEAGDNAPLVMDVAEVMLAAIQKPQPEIQSARDLGTPAAVQTPEAHVENLEGLS